MSATHRLLIIPAVRAAVFLLISVLALSNVMAQTTDLGEDTVFLDSFFNPENNAQGALVGQYTLLPTIETSILYSDNIFTDQSNASSDQLFTIRPAFSLRSDFNRHRFNLLTFLEVGRYRDFKTENYEDFGITADGQLDITGNTNIPLRVSHNQLHEGRENPDARQNIEPIVYRLTQITTGLENAGQKFVMKLLPFFQRFRFDEAASTNGTLDATERDRDVKGAFASIGVSPDAIIAPYLYAEYQTVQYDRNIGALNRNSSDFDTGLGGIITVSPITNIAFDIGQKRRKFDDITLNDITTSTFDGRISWSPLEEISVLLEANKTIQEAAFSDIVATINTRYRARINYELRDNFFIRPSISFLERDYRGIATGNIETYNAGLEMIYNINQNTRLNLNYNYTKQKEIEDVAFVEPFQRNEFGLSFALQF